MFAKTEGRLFGQRNADLSRGDNRTQPSQSLAAPIGGGYDRIERLEQDFGALITAIEEVSAQIRKRRYVETDERDRKIDAPVYDSGGGSGGSYDPSRASARVFDVQQSPQPTIEYPYSKDQPSPSPTYVTAYLAYMELSRAFDRVDTLDNHLSKRERAFLRNRFFRDSAR